jgi:hypothetical protein
MRVLFLERATRSGQTGYVAILDTVAIPRVTGDAEVISVNLNSIAPQG